MFQKLLNVRPIRVCLELALMTSASTDVCVMVDIPVKIVTWISMSASPVRVLIINVKTASIHIPVYVTMVSRDQTVPQKLTNVSPVPAVLALALTHSIPTCVHASPDIRVYSVMLISTNVSPVRAITARVWIT